MMHLMDAFGRTKMRYYCDHHEQACAIAADAYARQTGKLGVCLATSGPGTTNLLTGLVGAYQDSVPVLFLTGQCKRKETVRWRGLKGLRQCGFLEVDIVPIVESVTKYAAFVDEPADIRYHLERQSTSPPPDGRDRCCSTCRWTCRARRWTRRRCGPTCLTRPRRRATFLPKTCSA